MRYHQYPDHPSISLQHRYDAALETRPELSDTYHHVQGYAWGWQDAQGPGWRHTQTTIGFACAYVLHDPVLPIPDSWQSWITHGDLTRVEPTTATAALEPLDPPRHDLPEAVAAYHRAHGYIHGWREVTELPPDLDPTEFAHAHAATIAEVYLHQRNIHGPLDTTLYAQLIPYILRGTLEDHARRHTHPSSD